MEDNNYIKNPHSASYQDNQEAETGESLQQGESLQRGENLQQKEGLQHGNDLHGEHNLQHSNGFQQENNFQQQGGFQPDNQHQFNNSLHPDNRIQPGDSLVGKQSFSHQHAEEEQSLQFDSQPQQYAGQQQIRTPPEMDENQSTPPQEPKEATAGFCGKIPAHGDFVSRNLPDEFLDPWNQWTQTVIAASQEQLENLWLETYLTSPIWRFAASPGACCSLGFCGIMIPSVDKVGRYFPFSMIEIIDDEPLNIMRNGTDWFNAAQNVMLKGLEEDINIEELLNAAAELPTLSEIAQEKSSQKVPNYSIQTPHHSRQTLTLPLDQIEDTTPLMPGIAQILIKRMFPQHTIWWTEGSDRIQPTMLICEGMPPISGFSAMLDGDWDRWGWPKDQVSKI